MTVYPKSTAVLVNVTQQVQYSCVQQYILYVLNVRPYFSSEEYRSGGNKRGLCFLSRFPLTHCFFGERG